MVDLHLALLFEYGGGGAGLHLVLLEARALLDADAGDVRELVEALHLAGGAPVITGLPHDGPAPMPGAARLGAIDGGAKVRGGRARLDGQRGGQQGKTRGAV